MHYWTWLSAAGIAVLVFLITLTPAHDAFGVLYTLVIVLIAGRCSIKILRIVAIGCLVLECIAFFIVHDGALFNTGVARLALSVTATLIVTIIAERDKRARDTLERQARILAHADRIKALGQIGIAIAHEVNQPLSAIATFAQSGTRWLHRPAPDLKEALYCLAQIDANTRRAAAIIRNVQDMTRGEQVERRTLLDLRKVIQETITLLKNTDMSNTIEIHKISGGKLPFIHGNKTEIQQLIINLLMNASEAVTQAHIPAPVISVSAQVISEKGDFVQIQIKDNGSGFQNAPTDSYFEPFRTTKKSGMGMGLSICQTIVEAHGGTIRAENTPPSGAMVTVTLPLAEPAP